MVIIEFSMALTVYLVYLRKLSEFRFSKFKKIDFILPLSLIIVIQAGCIYFNSKFNGASENLIFDVRSILMLTLIIPFYEEIFYRGCLFGGLCSVFRKHIIIPIIFSSLVFSLMHTQFVSVLEYVLMFVVGVIISYSRVVTKGLLAPIAIHSGMNVFVISIQILS
ncbi:CPBP family intramembrane glutamic endopeptidase [Yokenella regensburgei]|uniref:CPBP family intramembrane glutamic endopeptidase n=1 Tax=Yokenella regensburgei TaxID=158877 RepID=UPI000570459A